MRRLFALQTTERIHDLRADDFDPRQTCHRRQTITNATSARMKATVRSLNGHAGRHIRIIAMQIRISGIMF
jgi:hypothetical protein